MFLNLTLSRFTITVPSMCLLKYVCFYLDYHFPKPSKLPLALTHSSGDTHSYSFGTYCFCYFELNLRVCGVCGVHS